MENIPVQLAVLVRNASLHLSGLRLTGRGGLRHRMYMHNTSPSKECMAWQKVEM
jgi:hypothetical protein